MVLAASSLQESLSEAAARYAGDGRPQPVLSFAGTSSLARQVESRVSAQIIIAADEEWMDVLERQDLLSPGTRADLLTNELVLVIPGGAKRAEGMAPLAGDGRIAMADPAAVPAGRYGKAALESLGRWDEVAPRIVPTENVRAALALVGRGEVAAGIVYATDAQASQRVSVSYRFPPQSHPPIRYPAALLAAGDNEGGRRFLAFPAIGRGARDLSATRVRNRPLSAWSVPGLTPKSGASSRCHSR